MKKQALLQRNKISATNSEPGPFGGGQSTPSALSSGPSKTNTVVSSHSQVLSLPKQTRKPSEENSPKAPGREVSPACAEICSRECQQEVTPHVHGGPQNPWAKENWSQGVFIRIKATSLQEGVWGCQGRREFRQRQCGRLFPHLPRFAEMPQRAHDQWPWESIRHIDPQHSAWCGRGC